MVFFLEPTSKEDSDLDGFDTAKKIDEDELENKAHDFNAVLAHAQAMAREAPGEKLKHERHYMGL